jgi:uncharacterized sulfatase
MRLLPLLLSLASGVLSLSSAAQPPNLVFIIADDCTYLDLGVYGGQAGTPHLDKLAAEGLIFTRCFQAAPMCSPTRHNIYTGLYPVKSGAWPNHTRVHDGTKSIAHFLGEAGYSVHLSGKTHIAPRESFPFDYSGEFASADPDKTDCYPAIDKLFAAATGDEPQPFCLFACSKEPHAPFTKGNPAAYPPEDLVLPPSWVDTPETRQTYAKYLAEITWFDRQCGALLALLDKHKLRDNTLVMVVSEQGSQFPFAKWTCYEMGLASGMIVRWPGHVQPGTSTEALVEYVDVVPTFLETAGAPIPANLDGKSFLPVLRGEKTEHKTHTFGIHTTRGIINGSDHYAIRSCGTKTHRYIRNLHPDETFENIVTRPRSRGTDTIWHSWKSKAEAGDERARQLTSRYQHRPAEELYHVATDPHCLHNLAADPAHAALKREFSAQLDRWMKSQGDQGHQTEHLAPTRQGNKSRPNNKR